MALNKIQNPQLDLRPNANIDAGKSEHEKEILKKREELENQKEELLHEIKTEDAPDKKTPELKSASELVADLSGDESVVKKEKSPAVKALAGETGKSLKKGAKPVLPKIEYETLEFPKGFLWGSSTSAYQVEGGIKNNWSEWETSEKYQKKLKAKGLNSGNYICGQACDSYNRYKEDFDLLEKINNNAFRFGLEWARLEPEQDSWDVAAINHYREGLAEAKKRGLVTVVTLWHWTLPDWFAREGAWEKAENTAKFLSYVDTVIKELGVSVDYWVTLNEPMVPIGFGYLAGSHPPGKKLALLK